MHIAHCLQKMFRIFIAELMLVVFQGLPTRLYYDDKSGTQGFLLCVCAKVNNCQSTAAAEESIDKVVLVGRGGGRGGGRGQNCGQSRTYRSHSSDYATPTSMCNIYTHQYKPTSMYTPSCNIHTLTLRHGTVQGRLHTVCTNLALPYYRNTLFIE